MATRKDKIQLNSHICKDSISFTFVEVGNTLPSLSSTFLRGATSKFGEALLQNFIINVFTLRRWAWFAVNSLVSHEYGLEQQPITDDYITDVRVSRLPIREWPKRKVNLHVNEPSKADHILLQFFMSVEWTLQDKQLGKLLIDNQIFLVSTLRDVSRTVRKMWGLSMPALLYWYLLFHSSINSACPEWIVFLLLKKTRECFTFQSKFLNRVPTTPLCKNWHIKFPRVTRVCLNSMS